MWVKAQEKLVDNLIVCENISFLQRPRLLERALKLEPLQTKATYISLYMVLVQF